MKRQFLTVKARRIEVFFFFFLKNRCLFFGFRNSSFDNSTSLLLICLINLILQPFHFCDYNLGRLIRTRMTAMNETMKMQQSGLAVLRALEQAGGGGGGGVYGIDYLVG
jgi:hypothetical protein